MVSGMLAATIVAGRIADQRGPAIPMYVGFALFGLGLVLGWLAPSVWVVLLARVVQGLGAGALNLTLGVTVAHGFFPFGAGPRFCPGRFLALLEIKAVISMLARNFEVERVDHGPVDEHLVVTMRPDNLSVRLRRRTKGAAATSTD